MTIHTYIKKATREVHSVEEVPTLLVGDEKLKDPVDMAIYTHTHIGLHTLYVVWL